MRYVIIDGQGELHNFCPTMMGLVGTRAVDSYIRRYQVPARTEAGESKLREVISWSFPGNDLQNLFPVEHAQP